MALNPSLDSSFLAILYPSEVVIDSQSNCFGSLSFTNGTLLPRNTGVVYLTNARVIFLHKNMQLRSQNFALHLNLINNELFTCVGEICVFTGDISPYSTFMPCSGKFKIELTGNTETFKKQVVNFIRQIRMVSHSPVVNGNNPSHQAFVDPADPDSIMIFGNKKP